MFIYIAHVYETGKIPLDNLLGTTEINRGWWWLFWGDWIGVEGGVTFVEHQMMCSLAYYEAINHYRYIFIRAYFLQSST